MPRSVPPCRALPPRAEFFKFAPEPNGLPFVPTDSAIHELLQNDGTLEAAQRIAGHADSRTTKLYDRRGQKVLLEDMERNAELGISFRGLNRFTVCSGSRFQE